MAIKEIILKNRILLQSLSVVLAIVGGLVSYFYYGTEPLETIGGFICGFAFAFFIIFISLKES